MTDPSRPSRRSPRFTAWASRWPSTTSARGTVSLTYLKRFPVNELKIDRSLVSGLDTDAEDRAIATSCIQLAHSVGPHAVAEGVETESQRLALVELGGEYAQGYLFSKPVPASELFGGVADAQAA